MTATARVLWIFVFLVVACALRAQSFSVFDIDTSEFPIMKAKFYAFDANAKQQSPLPPEIVVTEDGIPLTVLSITCPPSQPPQIVSVAMSIDVSGSMQRGEKGEAPVELGKLTAMELIGHLTLPPCEMALQTCNDRAFIIQDFTTVRPRLFSAITPVHAIGNNDFVEQLLNPTTGLLHVAKKGKYKRAAVIYTDAWWGALSANELQQCIDICNENDITFYAVIYTRQEAEPDGIKMSLQLLADATGGFLYDGVTSKQAAIDIASRLQEVVLGSGPCEITWESEFPCLGSRRSMEISWNSLKVQSSVKLTESAMLEIAPAYIRFDSKPITQSYDTTVTITAYKTSFNVTNIAVDNPLFDITPKNFTLQAGESRTLTVHYSPIDSSNAWAAFTLEAEPCPQTFYAIGYYPDQDISAFSLKVTHPNGNEAFVAGSDTSITWSGLPPVEPVSIEYSTDKGISWELITQHATGLSYPWHVPRTPSMECLVRIKSSPPVSRSLLPLVLLHRLRGLAYVEWSPDGSMLATIDDDTNKVKIWDPELGTELRTIDIGCYTEFALAWNPSGTMVAVGSADSTASIWDVRTGLLVQRFPGHLGWVGVVKWSPDGRKLATACRDGKVRVWDTMLGDLLLTLEVDTGYQEIYDVSWSPDGTMLATGGGNHHDVRVWDAVDGRMIHSMIGHSTTVVKPVLWSPDGKKIASGGFSVSGDNTVRIWDAATGKQDHLYYHGDWVHDLAWSPDGKYIVSGSSDAIAKVWDVENRQLLYQFTEHSWRVSAVSWDPLGYALVTASYDSTVKVIEAETGLTLQTLYAHTHQVYNAKWNYAGTRLATVDLKRDLLIWHARNNKVAQSDVSDAVFSIVMPEPLSHDVDMGDVMIGRPKDTLVAAFVSNAGTYQFRVYSIAIIGSSEFKLVSGKPPFIVPANGAQQVEFRFEPTVAGLRSAQIMIITQADTLYQTITGNGIQPIISTVGTVIDFGLVETMTTKDTVITIAITNTGTVPIDFTSDSQLGPDKTQFSLLSGGGTFTLQPNESREVSIRFAPRFIGRTSGRIGFHYNGPGSPAVLQLFGQGLGGLVRIVSDSAYPGENRDVALELSGAPSANLQSLAMGFRARVGYNSSVLAPFGGNVVRGSGVDTVTVEGNLNTDNSLTSVPFLAALGNAEVSSMDLVEFVWLDAQGQPANYDVETESGTFKLLGVCEEGGKRLFNPEGQVTITRISPNPASESVQVEIETIEAGRTQVVVMDVLGRTIATLYDGEIASGSHKLNLNTSQIAAGSYYVSLVTPTVKKFARVDIAR